MAKYISTMAMPWQLMVQDGLPAVWRGDSELLQHQQVLMIYIVIPADGIVYIYDGSAWQFMVQDGRNPSFSIGEVKTGPCWNSSVC